ncbi:MAG TPA: zinc ABC transporter substrate-binding protein [Candidatus Paceibacterota bacterium]|nr:zinc ABC transporter substrate-binding protein [Candidatus Paceibacterota bacterium]
MNMKYVAAIVGVLVIGGLGYVFFGHKPASAPENKLSVVASFYPMYFFASQIGGDRANVTNVTPSGGEPHDYEPTPQDVAKIGSAELVVLNGGGLEAWGDSVKQNIDPQKTVLVTAGEGLTTRQVVEDGENITDPHVWLSPVLAEQIADKIEQGYAKADPANADYYAKNASGLKARLASLDTDYKQGLASCKSKDIITSHAAFGYLGAAYGLNQVAISGLSPEEEPSPKQLADIADFAKKNNVKYIFFESLVSPKLSQTIATEVGAQTLVLDPIEGIGSDEMAEGANYFSVMESNLANLRIALQCN